MYVPTLTVYDRALAATIQRFQLVRQGFHRVDQHTDAVVGVYSGAGAAGGHGSVVEWVGETIAKHEMHGFRMTVTPTATLWHHAWRHIIEPQLTRKHDAATRHCIRVIVIIIVIVIIGVAGVGADG